MGSARQWLLEMTAGLMPRRLVVNHQRAGLLLEYEIGKELLPSIIEPLASKAVWLKAMSEVKMIAWEECIWTVSSVCLLEVVLDNSTNSIKVSVVLNAKITDPDRNRNWIVRFGDDTSSFSNPELRFLFNEKESSDLSAEDQNDSQASVIPIKFCQPD